jgi:hypothetical protein
MIGEEKEVETLSNIVVGLLMVWSLILFVVTVVAASLSWIHFRFGDHGVVIAATVSALYVLFWLRVAQGREGE